MGAVELLDCVFDEFDEGKQKKYRLLVLHQLRSPTQILQLLATTKVNKYTTFTQLRELATDKNE